MSERFDCDFFFGDSVFEHLRQFDAKQLQGFKGFLHAVRTNFKEYVWHKGARPLFRMRYSHFIITGDPSLIVCWLVMLWAKVTRRKVLMWTHGIHQHYAKWTSRLIYKSFFRMPDILLMYSEYNTQYMLDMGCEKSRIRYIHNSLDTEAHTAVYHRLKPSDIYHKHFGNAYPVVIYIGRLQERKKIGQLLSAIAHLRDNGNPHNLVLVGGVTDGYDVKERVASENLSDYVWSYGASYEEATNATLIYNADVCVCPAAVGLTAVHALSYGCPVVSNDNMETQMPECMCIVDGVTGSFFKEDDTKDLADKIQLWSSRSASEREATRQAARHLIETQWSVNYQMRLLESIIG